MSNFPHSASMATSFGTSPYAIQSNLENLINRAHSDPHARRTSNDFDAIHNGERPFHISPRLGPIREQSFNDGAAILLDNDESDPEDEDENGKVTEQSGLLSKSSSRRESRRTSYGAQATSEPFRDWRGGRRLSAGAKVGNSRSRSKARSPPRVATAVPEGTSVESTPGAEILHVKHGSGSTSGAVDDDAGSGHSRRSSNTSRVSRRGRDMEERPLSPLTSIKPINRRMSVASRFADDSSGDEGGDVARGLVASGGGAMMGTGLSGHGGAGGMTLGGGMEFDPAQELTHEDLEVPVDDTGMEVRLWADALRGEIPIILRLSLPVFFTQLSEWSLVLASVISIGHIGTTELAAASLASMTASVSCFSILQGLATAMDTLLPAAWTSSEPSRVGLWAQRMAVVLMVSMIPMFVVWWNIEGFLLRLGQEPDVAEKSASYLRWLSVGIPGYGGMILMKKYLQAQNIMSVPTYISFIVAPVNIALNLLLVWGPAPVRLGFVGGALATALSYILMFVLLLGWTLLYGPREAFHPVQLRHVFSKLGTVTSLGLAGTIMVSSEWWAWEVCALAASLLGPTNLAAQSCLLSSASTFFQVPASLGIASAVRVGNLLGAGRAWEAKWASRSSMFLSIVLASVNSIICLAFRKNWGYLFNNDPQVVAIVADIMPYIALFQITDGVCCCASSVLRALGLHTTGALINLTSYYIIGLPFGLWLTFEPRFNLGLVGLWIGLSVALGYASVVSFVLVWRADWVRACERVRERLGLVPVVKVGEDGKVDYPAFRGGGAQGQGEGGEGNRLLDDVEEGTEGSDV